MNGGGGMGPWAGQILAGGAYPALAAGGIQQQNVPYQLQSYPVQDAQPGARFRIEPIANGYLVHLSRSVLETFETHYAANYTEVGELVTATLVRWFIDSGAK